MIPTAETLVDAPRYQRLETGYPVARGPERVMPRRIRRRP
jgi:hypothetical protein